MTGKIALITGGSRGLGRSMVRHLAKKGVDVILTYNSNSEEAGNAVREITGTGQKALAIQLDTSTTAGFEVFTEKVQQALRDTWNRERFDFLVNNAGVGINKPFAEITESDFDLMMNIHLKGVFFLTQTLLPNIEDGGKILNISSGLTRFTFPGYATYATMKGAVEVLSRYLATELGPRAISVNTIAPGAVETDFGGGVVRDNKEVNSLISSRTAMGRAGLPDDIGGAVASLLTGHNDWITAQRIEVSGGQSL